MVKCYVLKASAGQDTVEKVISAAQQEEITWNSII